MMRRLVGAEGMLLVTRRIAPRPSLTMENSPAASTPNALTFEIVWLPPSAAV
jgi:hypothetical protein